MDDVIKLAKVAALRSLARRLEEGEPVPQLWRMLRYIADQVEQGQPAPDLFELKVVRPVMPDDDPPLFSLRRIPGRQ